MTKKNLAILMIILLGLGCTAFSFHFKPKELPKEKIINIAVERAAKLGFPKEQTTFVYDEGNKKIKENTRNAGVTTYNEKIDEWVQDPKTTPEKKYPVLEGRNYQAVYFSTNNVQLGGDLWIFVDKYSGEVLYYVFGK